MSQQRQARTTPAAPEQHAGTPVETVVGLVNDLLIPTASDDGLVVALAEKRPVPPAGWSAASRPTCAAQ